MQLALTPEEAAFRDELRTFYRTKIPEEIRERTRLGAEVSREDIVTSHKILNDNGLAVPNWPVEWGGKDWTPTQQQIWLDERNSGRFFSQLDSSRYFTPRYSK